MPDPTPPDWRVANIWNELLLLNWNAGGLGSVPLYFFVDAPGDTWFLGEGEGASITEADLGLIYDGELDGDGRTITSGGVDYRLCHDTSGEENFARMIEVP